MKFEFKDIEFEPTELDPVNRAARSLDDMIDLTASILTVWHDIDDAQLLQASLGAAIDYWCHDHHQDPVQFTEKIAELVSIVNDLYGGPDEE